MEFSKKLRIMEVQSGFISRGFQIGFSEELKKEYLKILKDLIEWDNLDQDDCKILFFIPFSKDDEYKNERIYLIPQYLYSTIPKNFKVLYGTDQIHKWSGNEKTNKVYCIKIKFFKNEEIKFEKL